MRNTRCGGCGKVGVEQAIAQDGTVHAMGCPELEPKGRAIKFGSEEAAEIIHRQRRKERWGHIADIRQALSEIIADDMSDIFWGWAMDSRTALDEIAEREGIELYEHSIALGRWHVIMGDPPEENGNG